MLTPDLCVIGAGAAGLSVAAGAAQMGAEVVLIERARMGGECLNTGCVPSKALLAAARAARALHEAARLGVHAGDRRTAPDEVRAHLRRTIAAIAPHDSQERFEGLGVRVLRTTARFLSANTLSADGTAIRARRFVVATGSAPVLPPVPGLSALAVLTNESLFDLAEWPDHLLVLGGGPVGVEMAQAHRLLGSRVSLIEQERLLPRDDPELVTVLRARLRADGIALHEGARLETVARTGGDIAATLAGPDGRQTLRGSHLLVAAGRRPVTEGLDLDRAGVAVTPRGITVDARLRTSNRRIYALGDVIDGPRFTHAAAYQAGIVLRHALFRLPARASYRALPWVTYTEPELAQLGLSEAAARERGRRVQVVRQSFADNDRARTEGAPEGLLKAVFAANGRVLGCGIVGREAGELIQTWALALSAGLKARHLAGMIAPYPTRGESAKAAASAFYAPKLFSARTRALVRALRLLG